MDEAQPLEQVGFRKGFSCLDHIQAVAVVIELPRIPCHLSLPLLTMKKLLTASKRKRSCQHWSIKEWTPYIRTLADCSSRCSTTVMFFQLPFPTPICKEGCETRQHYFVEAVHSRAAVGYDVARLEHKGHSCRWTVPLEFLLHEIALFSSSIAKAETMLAELDKSGKKVGLWINQSKTQFVKYARPCDGQMKIHGTPIKEISSYVHLGVQ